MKREAAKVALWKRAEDFTLTTIHNDATPKVIIYLIWHHARFHMTELDLITTKWPRIYLLRFLCIIFDDTALDLLAHHTLLARLFFAVVYCFHMGLGSWRLAGGEGGCLI